MGGLFALRIAWNPRVGVGVQKGFRERYAQISVAVLITLTDSTACRVR